MAIQLGLETFRTPIELDIKSRPWDRRRLYLDPGAEVNTITPVSVRGVIRLTTVVLPQITLGIGDVTTIWGHTLTGVRQGTNF